MVPIDQTDRHSMPGTDLLLHYTHARAELSVFAVLSATRGDTFGLSGAALMSGPAAVDFS